MTNELTNEQIDILREHFHRDVYKPDAYDKHRMVDALCAQAKRANGAGVVAEPVAKELAGVTLNYYDGKSLLHFEAVYPDGNQVPIFSVNKKFKAIADLIFNCVNHRPASPATGEKSD